MLQLIKRIAMLALLIVSFLGQNSNRMTGPEAKNAKPWKNSKTPSEVTTKSTSTLLGPEAKNTKPWKGNKSTVTKIQQSKKDKKSGPAAKNHKPWAK